MSIYNKYEVVRDKRLLNKMAKQGLIKLHAHTGTIVRHCMGGTIKAWYVDDCPVTFEYDGRKFGYHYFGGCFYPYVVEFTGDK